MRMALRTSARSEKARAVELMVSMGFQNSDVLSTLDSLLKVYGSAAGWDFIKQDGYSVVVEKLLGEGPAEDRSLPGEGAVAQTDPRNVEPLETRSTTRQKARPECRKTPYNRTRRIRAVASRKNDDGEGGMHEAATETVTSMACENIGIGPGSGMKTSEGSKAYTVGVEEEQNGQMQHARSDVVCARRPRETIAFEEEETPPERQCGALSKDLTAGSVPSGCALDSPPGFAPPRFGCGNGSLFPSSHPQLSKRTEGAKGDQTEGNVDSAARIFVRGLSPEVPRKEGIVELQKLIEQIQSNFEYAPAYFGEIVETRGLDEGACDSAVVSFRSETSASIFLDACRTDPKTLRMSGCQLTASKHVIQTSDRAVYKEEFLEQLAPCRISPASGFLVANVPTQWRHVDALRKFFADIISDGTSTDTIPAAEMVQGIHFRPERSEVFVQLGSECLADALFYRCGTKKKQILNRMSSSTFICRHRQYIPLLGHQRCSLQKHETPPQSTLMAILLPAAHEQSSAMLESELRAFTRKAMGDAYKLGSLRQVVWPPKHQCAYVVFDSESTASTFMGFYIDSMPEFSSMSLPLTLIRHVEYVRPGAIYSRAHEAGNTEKEGSMRGQEVDVRVSGLVGGVSSSVLTGALNEIFEVSLARAGVLEKRKKILKHLDIKTGETTATATLRTTAAAKALCSMSKPLLLAGIQLIIQPVVKRHAPLGHCEIAGQESPAINPPQAERQEQVKKLPTGSHFRSCSTTNNFAPHRSGELGGRYPQLDRGATQAQSMSPGGANLRSGHGPPHIETLPYVEPGAVLQVHQVGTALQFPSNSPLIEPQSLPTHNLPPVPQGPQPLASIASGPPLPGLACLDFPPGTYPPTPSTPAPLIPTPPAYIGHNFGPPDPSPPDPEPGQGYGWLSEEEDSGRSGPDLVTPATSYASGKAVDGTGHTSDDLGIDSRTDGTIAQIGGRSITQEKTNRWNGAESGRSRKREEEDRERTRQPPMWCSNYSRTSGHRERRQRQGQGPTER